MTRRRKPPITLEQLWQDGPLIRVRDVTAITSWSRQLIVSAVESGELESIRHNSKAKYCFSREAVREWLVRAGYKRPAA